MQTDTLSHEFCYQQRLNIFSDDNPVIALLVKNEENRTALFQQLADESYIPIPAESPEDLLQFLANYSQTSAIILDSNAMHMDGQNILSHLKASDETKHIPVIMQTSADSETELSEDIQSGIFYFLKTPHEEAELLSLLRAAILETKMHNKARAALAESRILINYTRKAEIAFRTLEDVERLAPIISSAFPEPEQVVMGMTELMVNAIEHGNLGISNAEKQDLMIAGAWQSEVERRLVAPEHCQKHARLDFTREPDLIKVTIRDCGEGFDYEDYLDINPSALANPNGRGIALARLLSFDVLEFIGAGNEVVCGVVV